MRHGTLTATVAMAAVLMITGCTTSGVDATKTTAIQPAASTAAQPLANDVSAADLMEGKVQFREANYGLAEKHFRKAVEMKADNAEAWMGLAACYDELGRFDFADRAYDHLLRVAGRKPQIVNNMGYSQLLRGNRKKAEALLLEARAGMADPTVVDANLALLNKG
jgi:Flp pilus assembly protein TadD